MNTTKTQNYSIASLDNEEYQSWEDNLPVIHDCAVKVKVNDRTYLDGAVLTKSLDELCDKMNFHVMKKSELQFTPQGKSLTYILSESHIGLHTWPEDMYMHIQISTCTTSPLDFEYLEVVIRQIFPVEKIKIVQFMY
jgi:S-adenosylmethionine decarboxylase